MRRVLDIVISLVGLVLTAPLFVVIALSVKLSSPGPIFYTPEMLGHAGAPFRLFRFRTMYVDQAHRPEGGRHPSVGRLIRDLSLDHLPMLINLLKGDLTLVGPRPMEPDRVNLQEPSWQRYFQSKPGVFSYAILQLGRKWAPTRESQPTLNQELESEYAQQRTALSDTRLVLRGLRSYLTSRGNVKARGKPDPDADKRIDQ